MKPREILKRFQEVLRVRSLASVARELGIDPSAINAAIRQRRLPDAWLYKVAYRTGVRIEWLQTGEEPQLLSEAVAEERALYHVDRETVLPLLERIQDLGDQDRESLELFLALLRSANSEVRAHLMTQIHLLARVPPPLKKRALP